MATPGFQSDAFQQDAFQIGDEEDLPPTIFLCGEIVIRPALSGEVSGMERCN